MGNSAACGGSSRDTPLSPGLGLLSWLVVTLVPRGLGHSAGHTPCTRVEGSPLARLPGLESGQQQPGRSEQGPTPAALLPRPSQGKHAAV